MDKEGLHCFPAVDNNNEAEEIYEADDMQEMLNDLNEMYHGMHEIPQVAEPMGEDEGPEDGT
ncbi:hypothetical protein QJS10_CPA09g01063 [Acorus calamus]|uniref:Uncharacterized protein n=1 Tax=Acorus calamus TaxID=4465 RepID=A0AAV9E5E3_ACOCL|nr:hypothetical protein QJS10_CPA09g01063 [Acorus calamus]